MATIDEKRVYADREGRETVLVAARAGLATVAVSDGRVGEFGLARRCDARDVAARDGTVALATADDLLVGTVGDLGDASAEGLADTGFGPAVAVGLDPHDLLAAGPDGRVARHEAGGGRAAPGRPVDDDAAVDGATSWIDLGVADGPVRAIDGDLVASDAGVYRAGAGVVGGAGPGPGDGLHHAGLSAVRDVSAAGVPHAATADGLYRLGNGWMDVLGGDFRVVAADPGTAEPGRPGRAHAATPDALFAHRDGEWEPAAVPVEEPVVAVAHGEASYAVTESGTFLADAGDGWRSRSLGLDGVRGLAVV